MKFTISVTDFRPLHRNTLRGFCVVHIDELKLTLHDISVHLVDNAGVARRTDDGKIAYARLFSFDSRGVGDAFSALLEHNAKAFDHEVA